MRVPYIMNLEWTQRTSNSISRKNLNDDPEGPEEQTGNNQTFPKQNASIMTHKVKLIKSHIDISWPRLCL